MTKSYKDKLNQYEFLKMNHELRESLPETKRLTHDSFSYFLSKYEAAIIKPTKSSGGSGVIKVWYDRNGIYRVHMKQNQKQFKNKNAAYSHIKKLIKNYKKKYPDEVHLIQYCIPLAQVDERPFDIRLVVQRKKGFDWEVIGKYARVAKEGVVTTNLKRGGTPYTLSEVIDKCNLKQVVSISSLEANLDRIALKIAEMFSNVRANEHIWGIDFGIDLEGKIWIIETNTRPRIKGFKIVNKVAYKKIKSYIKWNESNDRRGERGRNKSNRGHTSL